MNEVSMLNSLSKICIRKEKCSTNAGCPIDSLIWHLHNLLYSMTFSLSKYIFAFIWEKCFWSRSMREHEWESMFMYIFLMLLMCVAYFLTLILYSSLKDKSERTPNDKNTVSTLMRSITMRQDKTVLGK